MNRKEIFICLVLIVVAVVRYFFFLPKFPYEYEKVAGEKVNFTGVVVDAPDVRINNQRLTINPENTDTNILVVADKDLEISYGDMVNASGVLEKPENFVTDAGKEFNYKRYLANKDIYFIVQNADVEIVSHDNGSTVKKYLFKLRENFMKNINGILSPPESHLANGLLLGARGGFDNKTRDEFINTGTIHIVALSGYNVTIVAESILKVFGTFLSQALSLFIGGIFVVLFVVMSGAGATAIRAGIMAIILLFGRLSGRTYDAARALVIAGLLMIAYDLRVVTDVSFQLSFLATFGILFITPKTVKWVMFLPTQFKFRETVATTLAATISVLPLLLYTTGILSIVSLPANVLILPFIPLTMLFAFIAGIMAFINPTLGILFGYLAYIFLAYILRTIHFFASLPFASFTIKQFPLILTLVLYALIFWWVFEKREIKERKD